VIDLSNEARSVRAIDVRVGGGSFSRDPVRAGSQGFALATLREGGRLARVLAPMASVDPGPAKATSIYGGADSWGPSAVMPFVAVVDAGTERPFAQTLAQSGALEKPCILPRAAATFGSELLVACFGVDALVDFDARGHAPARVERRRWKLAPGPNGVAVDEAHARAVVWSQFARELAVVDLVVDGKPIARASASRRRDSRMTPLLARGRALFNATTDLRISGDGRACASCHPDGREDGLTWSTPVGPRQTIMLAGRIAGTGPYGWFGASATVKQHVTHTLHRLGGQGMADGDRADFDALIAYVTSLRGPNLEGGRVEASKAALAARGRELFFDERQGCASCHVGGGTDNRQHDVGSGNVIEASLRFDTPSLQFVGGTAPYFHDGRYATLVELLERSDGTMGHTTHLGTEETLALAAFLETIGSAPRAVDAPVATTQSASGAVPSGWFVPEAPEKLAAAARPGSFRARVAELAKERHVEPVALDIGAIPVTVVDPHRDLPSEVKELPPGEKADDILTVDYRVVARGKRFGWIVVDWDARPFFARAEGGAAPHTSHGIKRIEYRAFSVLPDGTGELEQMEGYYDVEKKIAVAVRRLKVKAMPFASGLAYAYRTFCPRCDKDRDVLHVVTPGSGWGGPFGESQFDLAEREGGSLLETFSPGAVDVFRKSGATPPFRRNVRLGIEVTRDSADAAPKAFVYAGEVTL
jgi:hypothetical protein